MARLISIVAVAALVACGQVSKNSADGSSAGGSAGSAHAGNGAGGASGGVVSVGGTPADLCSGTSPPSVPMRLLAQTQLRNELALFGDGVDGETLPYARSDIYSGDVDIEVDSHFVAGHADFVTGLAKRITADPARIGKLLDCDASAVDTTVCQKKLYQFVIDRLFRGQEQMETQSEVAAVFDTGVKLGGGFASGVRAVLEVALQSPEFLYRAEVGRPAAERSSQWLQPTDVEMASRLSFLLWDRGPDAELLAAAHSGRLTEPADIEAQARRLLGDERAQAAVTRFYRELLFMYRDFPQPNPERAELTAPIERLMDLEFDAFVGHATFDAPGNFASLFQPVTWVNSSLASYYGLAPVGGDALQLVATDARYYAGIVTQPAFLVRKSSALYTNPVLRGLAIAEGFLCNDVPPEPPSVPPPDVPIVEGPQTTRQRFEAHSTNAVCVSCHAMMDPIGFTLEHIDETGRYRETDMGLPIDTSGQIMIPFSAKFGGAQDLGQVLTHSADVRSCFVRQWERFAYGRTETDANKCSEALVRERFHDGGDGSLKELLVALTQTESFRFKKAVEVTK